MKNNRNDELIDELINAFFDIVIDLHNNMAISTLSIERLLNYIVISLSNKGLDKNRLNKLKKAKIEAIIDNTFQKIEDRIHNGFDLSKFFENEKK